MSKIGILWNDPARWVVGKNCHLETIVCPGCGGIEAATVLHTAPEFLRLHRCGGCGKLIGSDRWRLAAAATGPATGSPSVPGASAATPTPVPIEQDPQTTATPPAGNSGRAAAKVSTFKI